MVAVAPNIFSMLAVLSSSEKLRRATIGSSGLLAANSGNNPEEHSCHLLRGRSLKSRDY